MKIKGRTGYCGVLVLIAFAGAVAAAAGTVQESDLQSVFASKGISVSEVKVEAATVSVKVVYPEGTAIDLNRMKEDIVFLFSKTAEHSPESQAVRLLFMAGEIPVSVMEVDSVKARELGTLPLSTPGLLSTVRMSAGMDIEGALSSELQAQAERADAQPPPGPLLPERTVEVPEGAEPGGMPGGGGGGGGLVSAGTGIDPLVILVLLLGGIACLIAVLLVVRRRSEGGGAGISARLDIIYIDGGRKSYEVRAARTTIGRSSDNDLVLSDSQVSGHHAEVVVSGSSFVLRDLGSANGTKVNGVRIKEAALYLGDEISLGTTKIRVG